MTSTPYAIAQSAKPWAAKQLDAIACAFTGVVSDGIDCVDRITARNLSC
jgi:hypothetical protein